MTQLLRLMLVLATTIVAAAAQTSTTNSLPVTAVLTATNGTSEQLGASLASLGSTTFVGAPQFTRSAAEGPIGAVLLLSCVAQGTAITCTQLNQTIFAADANKGDNFGASLATSEDSGLLAVGATGANSKVGRVYLYDCSAATSCSFINTLVSPYSSANTGSAGQQFGFSLAFGPDSTSSLVVFSYAADPVSFSIGYVFNCENLTATASCTVARSLAPSALANSHLGSLFNTYNSPPVFANTFLIAGSNLQSTVFFWDLSSMAKCRTGSNGVPFVCSETGSLSAVQQQFSGFGAQVLFLDNLLIVGAPEVAPSANLTNVGATFIYQCPNIAQCTDASSFQVRLDDVLGAQNDIFGTALGAIDITASMGATQSTIILAVGAPGVSLATGQVYLYNCTTSPVACSALGSASGTTTQGDFGSALLGEQLDGIPFFIASAPFTGSPSFFGGSVYTIQDPALVTPTAPSTSSPPTSSPSTKPTHSGTATSLAIATACLLLTALASIFVVVL